MQSNVGKWNTWYVGLTEPQDYGETTSYEIAANWLSACDTIGDWGCGKGGFKKYIKPPRKYWGFDGSDTPFAGKIVDLAAFQFKSEGILLRHVIEHDEFWRDILENALESFTRRLVVVLFTPMLESPEPIVKSVAYTQLGPKGGVPDLSFSLAAITTVIPPELLAEIKTIKSNTQYGTETILMFER